MALSPSKLLSRSEEEMLKIGADLAHDLKPGDILLLNGTLGMGKTVLARGLIRAYMQNPALEIPSPTFTLVQLYEPANGVPLFHYDLYRLKDPDEIFELGWEDSLADGITIVEWPERLGPYKPANTLDITITAIDNEPTHREILIQEILSEKP